MFMRLDRHRSERSERYDQVLRSLSKTNLFNPSAIVHEGTTYMAFRAFHVEQEKPFHGYLLIDRMRDNRVELIDLTERLREFGVELVADPKLVILGQDVWVTFNTGWSKEGNQLYLCRVTPTIERPRRCQFEGRQAIEKNWAFFLQDGSLLAIYSLDGPQVLVAANFDQPDEKIVFEIHSHGSERCHLSIGTQAVPYSDGFLLIAHEKWRFWNRRLYWGRAVVFRCGKQNVGVKVSSRRLFFSPQALLGNRLRHNKNLQSCTYFSSLQLHQDRLLLGYGVNDVDFGFSDVGVSRLIT